MSKRNFIILIISIFVILGGAAAFKNQQTKKIDDIYTREDAVNDVINRPTETINAKYQYKDGRHTLVGTAALPTPCHNFNVEVIQKSELEVEVAINTYASDEICIQQVTDKTFKVSFEGGRDELMVASLNGEIVNLNLFEVPDSENIDDIQVDFKG